MHVYAQGLTAHLLGVDAGGIGEPVVSVDDVEFFRACHHACDDRVVIDFLMQVRGIAARKLHSTQVVDVHVVEVGIDVVAIAIVVVRRHDRAHTLLHVVVVDVAPGNRHSIHGHDFASRAVFVAEGFRQTENGIDIALSMQALGDTVVGCGESAKHMRRILPSKH